MQHKKAGYGILLFLCLVLIGGGAASAADRAAAPYTENSGTHVERLQFIPTTKPAVIFTFGGLSKGAELDGILTEMAAQGMRGTFFVTERELQRNGENIRRIVAAGQDLGIGLRTEEGADTAAYEAQIQRIQTALRTRYGVTTNIVRQMSGADEPAISDAVSALGCVLVGQGVNVVQSKHKDAQSSEEIMPQIFGRWITSLNLGQIVYLRMDFYTRPGLAADMLRAIKAQKVDNIAYAPSRASDAQAESDRAASRYQVCSVQDALSDRAHLYTYPVNIASLPQEMQPYVREPKLTDKTFFNEFLKRYIGAPEVGENDRMLGFSRAEMRRADHTGVVKTVADNTVFFTFDDWGNDYSINHLVSVLNKHRVHGTFFVITWNIHNNPNLLRAIAAAGNEIGSHTNWHKPMTIRDEKRRQVPVQSPQEYDEDVRSSYEKLLMTVGDMKLPSGRPVLTRLLRPPTLAVSRMGSEAILNNGFTYIVNGSGSTEDYSAVSMESLVGILHRLTHEDDGTVKRGAILIMHMSATATRTAEALDILLTANDLLPEGDPGKFKVGLLGDYLVDGYSQTMKQAERVK